MVNFRLWLAILYGLVAFSLVSSAAGYAHSIVEFEGGEGDANGFINPEAVLGKPSALNAGGFAVDPFNPPFGRDQVVTLLDGAFLTIEFDQPIFNHPSNPHGLDFQIFGNSGFVITNLWDPDRFDFVGVPATDGTLFGAATATTRVSVSRDNEIYYLLDPAKAPTVDRWYPTDGGGNFTKPVNPARVAEDFQGQDLVGIREQYEESGGGAAYDLSWALDAAGRPVDLDYARFVRVESASGRVDIDGFSVVRPPSVVREFHFDRDPVKCGWQVVGDDSPAIWSAAESQLQMTWDSEKSNRFFLLPLNTSLNKSDDFQIYFELTLASMEVESDDSLQYAFEISLGLVNIENLSDPDFIRGTGDQSPDLVEFDYFPDTGFGATVSPAISPGSGVLRPSFTVIEMTVADTYSVAMNYIASQKRLDMVMTRNGRSFGPIAPIRLQDGFTDFRVDAFALSSYQDHSSRGSVLAQGSIERVVLVTPPLPVRDLRGEFSEHGRWRVSFFSSEGWAYLLQRSPDMKDWVAVADITQGGGGELMIEENEAFAGPLAFYRIKANRE